MAEARSVTAAHLVIGDEILSGRTKEQNIGYVADCLASVGIDLREARVIPDENYYLPDDLEAQIKAFVAADVYFGQGQTMLIERERIKRQTIANRRLRHQRQAA